MVVGGEQRSSFFVFSGALRWGELALTDGIKTVRRITIIQFSMFSGALFHAPNSKVLLGSPSLTPSPPTSPASYSSKFNRSIRLSSMASSVRIVVVGDVHDDWDLQEDSKALELLQLQVFVWNCSQTWCCLQAGFFMQRLFLLDYPASFLSFLVLEHFLFESSDFGNENVELVRSIAALKIAKAAILGNHDAWNTQNFSEKYKDAVQVQLKSFGEEHVGYQRLDFHPLKLSVIGGRPFSCGGERLFRKQLLAKRYGVNNMNESAKRISDAASGTPKNHSIIILAHNGPTGLGSNVNDICGRDWVRGGGDHGDPDLALAISQLKGNTEYAVPLVVFGHMHKELAFGAGPRKMIVVGDDNTIYLNGAIVPRVKRFCDSPSSENAKRTSRAFTLIDSKEGKVEKIAETWVSVNGDNTNVEEEHILFGGNMLNTSNL
ncbi:hypothetical protein SSX86_002880 [Deinandra increscens subsp. villosa]|uniref:Calcineurin-like phosphoesterase domain-containing protein n=1 Tax=Deinandra increscens subsp. villosa TaxID=3103831 RepID=A0AAP0HBQ6_9ASTR